MFPVSENAVPSDSCLNTSSKAPISLVTAPTPTGTGSGAAPVKGWDGTPTGVGILNAGSDLGSAVATVGAYAGAFGTSTVGAFGGVGTPIGAPLNYGFTGFGMISSSLNTGVGAVGACGACGAVGTAFIAFAIGVP